MKIKLLLALALLLLGATSAFAQASGAANGSKTKVAIIDVLSFRDQVGELKAKYEKLQMNSRLSIKSWKRCRPKSPIRKKS
ncbi:MAG: hypothetical protein U0X75_17760 [Acidobacteriota bacterium]